MLPCARVCAVCVCVSIAITLCALCFRIESVSFRELNTIDTRPSPTIDSLFIYCQSNFISLKHASSIVHGGLRHTQSYYICANVPRSTTCSVVLYCVYKPPHSLKKKITRYCTYILSGIHTDRYFFQAMSFLIYFHLSFSNGVKMENKKK